MQEPSIANTHLLLEKGARYLAPVFQRPYVWGREQLDSLFEDLEASMDGEAPAFLGAIVLQDIGNLSGPVSPRQYLIVDGQQRLTTLYLVLLAIASLDVAKSDGERARLVVSKYLADWTETKYHGAPKLVLTIGDRRDFMELLERSHVTDKWRFSFDPPEASSKAHDLTSQFKRIERRLSDLVVESGRVQSERLDTVLESILRRLQMVAIVLDQTDDANEIFSKLNAQGIGLELSDLVRNDVFGKFAREDPVKAKEFHLRAWLPFERGFEDKSIDGFFSIFALIRKEGEITKAHAFPTLQQVWRKKAASEVLKELERYAPLYQALCAGTPIPGLGVSLSRRVARFAALPKTTVTWPFVMSVLRAALDGKLDAAHADSTLWIVESFLVRRAVCGYEPTGLHAVFKGLWKTTQGDPKLVRKNLVTRTIVYPDDQEVIESIKEKPIDRAKITKFLLMEYESHLRKSEKADPLPRDLSFSIEHVMPQKKSKSWLSISKADHQRLVGTLGNLVPLSRSQNSSVQDEGWETKRQRFKGSNWFSAKHLATGNAWTAAKIRERNRELRDWLLGEWPRLEAIRR